MDQLLIGKYMSAYSAVRYAVYKNKQYQDTLDDELRILTSQTQAAGQDRVVAAAKAAVDTSAIARNHASRFEHKLRRTLEDQGATEDDFNEWRLIVRDEFQQLLGNENAY